MYKLIFSLLTDPLGLPINDLWEYLILLIIGKIAFSVGWEVSTGGRFGSEIHWLARLIVFYVLWAITYGIIAVCQWIIAHWVVCIAMLAALIITLVVVRNRIFEKTQ